MSPEKEMTEKTEENEVQLTVGAGNTVPEDAADEDGVPAAPLAKEVASIDSAAEEGICQNGDGDAIIEDGGEVRVDGSGGEGGDIGTSEC